MLRKTLLATGLMIIALGAQADYKCAVTPRDDVVLKPQTVQVVGQNGDLIIAANGGVTFNGKPMSLTAAQRQQALNYQTALRTDLPWIDSGARTRLEKARAALDKIITEQVGADSNMHKRLTTLDGQLKQQMNQIIEQRSDGFTFHYQGIDKVRTNGQQLVNATMGGILQDSINEMGAQALTKGGGGNLQSVLGNLGGMQNAIQNEWKSQEKDFDRFGKEVCRKVESLEDQRTRLVSGLK